uniref:Peritrophin-1-like n=1 Tax=Diabrotica virgifera virgifera TaxID=50390 RepID=A0A6P7GDZ8_DIAVI
MNIRQWRRAQERSECKDIARQGKTHPEEDEEKYLILVWIYKYIILVYTFVIFQDVLFFFVEQAKPSPGCPRQNGFYRHPKDCTKFHSCVDGKPKELNCPAGLVYDEEKSICIWAASSKREECLNPKKDALDDGFECPIQSVGNDGRKVPHPTYAHPSDCQKFYICRNGVDPQKGSCSPGTVYNEDTSRCDDPKNVEGW